jgi:hypothetical protein
LRLTSSVLRVAPYAHLNPVLKAVIVGVEVEVKHPRRACGANRPLLTLIAWDTLRSSVTLRTRGASGASGPLITLDARHTLRALDPLWASGASGADRALLTLWASGAGRARRPSGALDPLGALKATRPLRADERVCDPVIIEVCWGVLVVVYCALSGELDPVIPAVLVAVVKERDVVPLGALWATRALGPLRALSALGALITRDALRALRARRAHLTTEPSGTGGAYERVRDPVTVLIKWDAPGVIVARAHRDLNPIIPAIKVCVVEEADAVPLEPLWATDPLLTCGALYPLWARLTLRSCWASDPLWALYTREPLSALGALWSGDPLSALITGRALDALRAGGADGATRPLDDVRDAITI